MIDAVADSLFERLHDAFPSNRAYTRAAFERGPMPPLLSHYLRQALQRRLDDEIGGLRSARSAAFDYDHPEVHQAHQAFVAVLAQHGRIPRDEWAEALRRAVQRVVAYLIRPTRTLTEHVFEGEEGPLPAHVVYRRLSYFAAYPYLRDVVEAYFEQRNVQTLERSRFTELIARIDRQMTEDYDADSWLRLLTPLFEFLQLAPRYENGVPLLLLRAFFLDKDAHAIAQRIQDESQRGTEMLDREALRRLLTPQKAPAAAPLPEAETVRAEKPSPPPAAESDEALPLWKRFQQGRPAAPPSPPPAPQRPAPPPPRPTADDRAVPLWKQFHHTPGPETDGAASPAASEIVAVERAVLGDRGPRNRDLFVKHLFSGSAADYERTLRRLQNAPSWTQASQIIAEEVFLKHRVNIYSEPAVAFTDAVEAQFRG